MIDKSSGEHISSLIDELWRHPKQKTILAGQLTLELNQADWLILASWDVAATFGPPTGKLDLIYPGTMQIRDNMGKLWTSNA